MDQSKLYSALLKTQAKAAYDAERFDARDAEMDYAGAPTSEEDPVYPEMQDEHRIERPFDNRRPATPIYGTDKARQAPTVFDSTFSLDLINNPKPWSMEERRKRKIIYPGMKNKAILDAYREIRIKLRNLSGAKNFSVLLTSLSRKPGSAITAFNLATSFSLDAQSSALLIDCDPYHSDMQKLVSTTMMLGVTDFIADRSLTVNDIIYPSGIDRLTVIPAGNLSITATELFSSQRMRDLMSELQGRYADRYIVVNAPALPRSTEARILVRYVEHAVLSVPFGEIGAEDVMTAVASLDPEKFAGLVFQE